MKIVAYFKTLENSVNFVASIIIANYSFLLKLINYIQN
jgi:hypothetical protein